MHLCAARDACGRRATLDLSLASRVQAARQTGNERRRFGNLRRPNNCVANTTAKRPKTRRRPSINRRVSCMPPRALRSTAHRPVRCTSDTHRRSAHGSAAAGGYTRACTIDTILHAHRATAISAEQAQAFKTLGMAAAYQGDFAQSAEADDEGRAGSGRRTGDLFYQGVVLGNLSEVYLALVIPPERSRRCVGLSMRPRRKQRCCGRGVQPQGHRRGAAGARGTGVSTGDLSPGARRF